MAIQKQFVLRYREEGHVRFEIPESFCDRDIAGRLTEMLLSQDGVYRVRVYRSRKKLSIRYQDTVCDFQQVARQLFRIVGDLERQLKPVATSKVAADNRPSGQGIKQWLDRKYTDAKETLQAAKIVTKVGIKQQRKFLNDPEKAAIDFFNDILALFLIRLHWDHITKDWIPKPFKHRYEWMAVFYMIFLLMRSRRPKK